MQVMDENGNIDASLFPNDLQDSKIVDMYKYMAFTRALDTKVLSLQRQGRAYTYAPSLGEEATQIGSAFAMRKNDMFFPYFRQHGVYLVRGLPLDLFFLYWKGYEDGNVIPKEVNGFTYVVPVGSQMPHAAGAAFAQKYMKTGAVVIGYVGDGGTSEGDFSEAINFAGVFKLPLVTLIENNQWAISVPRSMQSAAQTLAQKGFGAGMECVQVDGNDPIAVYKATKEAIDKAAKNIPTVIECLTYRLSMHTTADDPTKYRTDTELDAWKAKDPMLRVRKYLTTKKLWNDDMESKMNDEQKKIIDAGVEKAESFKADPKSMFNIYSFLPDILKDELDDATASNWYGEVK